MAYALTYLSGGQRQQATVQVADVAGARAWAAERGYALISAKPSTRRWWEREVFSREQRLNYLLAVKFRVNVGSSPARALQEVIEAEGNPRVRKELEPALTIIRAGGAVSDALAAVRLVDDTARAILQAGETGGATRDALDAAIAHIEANNAVAKRMSLPLLLIGGEIAMSFASLVGMQYTAIPWIAENTSGGDAAAREAFARAVDTAYLANGTMLWLSVILGLVVTAALLGYFRGRGVWRDRAEWALRHMPGVGALLIDKANARALLVLSRLLGGHVRLAESITIVRRATAMPSVRAWLDVAQHRLQCGQSFAQALAAARLSSAELAALSAAQSRAELAQVAGTVAQSKEDLANRAMWRAVGLYGTAAIAYSLVSAGIGLWLVLAQNDSVAASFSQMMGG